MQLLVFSRRRCLPVVDGTVSLFWGTVGGLQEMSDLQEQAFAPGPDYRLSRRLLKARRVRGNLVAVAVNHGGGSLATKSLSRCVVPRCVHLLAGGVESDGAREASLSTDSRE